MAKKKKAEGKGNPLQILAAHEMLIREIGGILMFALVALSVFAVALGGHAYFLWYLNDTYKAMMGIGAFWIPALLLFIGLFLTLRKKLFAKLAVNTVVVAFLFTVTAHVTNVTFAEKLRGSEAAAFCMNGEILRSGGGYFGGIPSCAAMKFIAWYGTYTVVFALLLLYVKALTKISYIELFRKAAPYLQKAWAVIHPIMIKSAAAVGGAVQSFKEKRRLAKEEAALAAVEEKPALSDIPSIPCPIEPAKFEEASPFEEIDEEPKKKFGRRKEPKPVVAKEPELPLIEEEPAAPVVLASDGGDSVRMWKLPTADDWLEPLDAVVVSAFDESLKMKLETALKSFQVPAKISAVVKGATFTRFEIELEAGVRVSRVVSLETDIALALATDSRTIRIEAPIPGKSAIGIEVPNREVAIVPLRKIFLSNEYQKQNMPLAFVLGEDISACPVIANISKMPHLLVAGSTNSGKSVCINSIISSIISRQYPEDVRFILVDQKRVELTPYEGIPHLLASVITEAAVAASALKWVCSEMDRRYKLFAEMGVRTIDSYNQLMEDPADRMHRIVVIIDELADLMMVSSPAMNVELYICRIAQLARATGIHIILATQRPDTKVVTGTIKNNIPSRISFSVASQIDSRTILDQKGAESLLGRGDMLYMPSDSNKLVRLQGVFVRDQEVRRLVDFWKAQGPVEYPVKFAAVEATSSSGSYGGGGENESEDETLYRRAVEIIVSTNQVSISMLQRKLRIGYNRAARLVDLMEERNIVGPYDGTKPREIRITSAEMSNLEF